MTNKREKRKEKGMFVRFLFQNDPHATAVRHISESLLIFQHISSIRVSKYLKFIGNKLACDMLEDELKQVNAVRFKMVLKAMCVGSFIWFSGYYTYLTQFSASESLASSTQVLYLMAILASPGMFILVSSKYYMHYSQPLIATVCGALGVGIIVHKVLIQDFSNMLLSLFVILLFTATPLLYKYVVMLTVLTIAGFIVAVFVVRAHHDDGLPYMNLALLGAVNMLALFSLSYVMYYRELNLRKSVINKHLLMSKHDEVAKETAKNRNLLKSMLPECISDQLKKRSDEGHVGSTHIAEKFGPVTVMFVEVCHFNQISAEMSQDEVLDILNTVYSVFDSVLEDYDIYKVETVGQVYLVVGGCPQRSRRHAEDIGELALEFLSVVPEINHILKTTVPNLDREVQVRIGLNSGSIVAGVVGQRCQRYKLFGDPVNTASRMQSTCPEGMIQCSGETYKALRDKFILSYRGLISVKGKGEMETYFLLARRDTIDQGRNAIKDKGEMQMHIDKNHNVLFRSWSGADGSSGYNLTGSKKYKVAPMESVDDDSKDESSQTDQVSIADSRGTVSSEESVSKTGFKFTIGSKAFRRFQHDRGVINIAKFCNILLKLLPLVLIVELIVVYIYSEHESQNSDFVNMLVLMICTTVFMFVVFGVVVFIARSREYQKYMTIAVEGTFSMVAMMVIAFNLIGHLPNPSNLMVTSTYFLNIQIVPLFRRFVWCLLFSVLNCIGLIILVRQRKDENLQPYFRYTMENTTLVTSTTIPEHLAGIEMYERLWERVTFTNEDILIHFLLLVLAIGLQLWCVVIQDNFLSDDFDKNEEIKQANSKLSCEKQHATTLLSQLLPPSIVPKLVAGNEHQTRIVDRFENVTILFTDMVKFTAFSQKISPLQLMHFLNAMYTKFDAITEKYNLYKVEVIGDAYFIVGGCPIVSSDHTERVVRAAQEMLECLPELTEVAHEIMKQQHRELQKERQKEMGLKNITEKFEKGFEVKRDSDLSTGQPFGALKNSVVSISGSRSDSGPHEQEDDEVPCPDINIRIGVHVGSVVAGVVGFKDPRYHIFGDAVSFANMLEAKGKPGKVHASSQTLDEILKNPGAQDVFEFETREPIDMSPITSVPQRTYFLSVKKNAKSNNSNN
mmetsp:Transcript_6621/g.11691  ORF Transcript_6621/g.11691 Transcript_6621/m.11691 type:complete len:1130 (-) Transcript_6621:68-3457(-)|eukprot:CAMPEP_0203759436 /NCGR_PEP_ID=MMETSP0098-20131031/12463_1 /ASSEMBLY_ACC=CAM_ASM_000208 /TAXON_ID=96639 /ORGANISM=" , Strain NY0313808BC1" /LENGTH=1129 /DNA_ID=CAMNT_0050652391 /DNA_START=4292 /DNA_END=7681 /DNA_ORIENTATION=+